MLSAMMFHFSEIYMLYHNELSLMLTIFPIVSIFYLWKDLFTISTTVKITLLFCIFVSYHNVNTRIIGKPSFSNDTYKASATCWICLQWEHFRRKSLIFTENRISIKIFNKCFPSNYIISGLLCKTNVMGWPWKGR